MTTTAERIFILLSSSRVLVVDSRIKLLIPIKREKNLGNTIFFVRSEVESVHISTRLSREDFYS